jgi:salicylate hydroxylase
VCYILNITELALLPTQHKTVIVMSPALVEEGCLELAVVGGGIAGIALAIGLLRHNVKVKVYEQSRGFREIGAGIAFTKAVVGCMELIDPALGTALKSSGSVSISDGNKTDPNDYLRWLDGYNQPSKEDPSFERKLCDLDAGYKGFYGCRRDQFLEAAGKVLPEGVIEFGKRVESIEEREGQKIQLTFKDGSSAKADAGM